MKKLGAIPPGGGWKLHGRGKAPSGTHAKVGYRYIHTAIDDRTRLAYSEILGDEQGPTAAGFWRRAHLWFELQGITTERCLTDNGSCYRSRAWAAALADTTVTHKRTRPYRPQTNGKVERFHRILLEEWAYIRPWTSEHERYLAYDGFIHFYNHHRSHGALAWATPHETLTQLAGDNLPADTPIRPTTSPTRPPPARFEQAARHGDGVTGTRTQIQTPSSAFFDKASRFGSHACLTQRHSSDGGGPPPGGSQSSTHRPRLGCSGFAGRALTRWRVGLRDFPLSVARPTTSAADRRPLGSKRPVTSPRWTTAKITHPVGRGGEACRSGRRARCR